MVRIGMPSALVTATISVGDMITQRFIKANDCFQDAAGWGMGMVYGVSRYLSGSWMNKRLVK